MSSLGARPLRHVLYTNARGEDREQGYRLILDYFDGDEEAGKAIGEWLRSLKASDESGYGWTVQCFSVKGERHAALAILNSRFGYDEIGRVARLAHALLLPVAVDQPDGHFFLALYEAAKPFLPQQLEQILSLKDYRGGCEAIRDIKIPDLDLVRVNPEFLREFLIAAAHFQTGMSLSEVSLPGVGAEEELPEMLTRAGGTLPPSLRLALPWATGLKPAPGLVVVHRQVEGDDPLGIRGNLGEVYFEWLQERLNQHQFNAIRELAEESSIISWDKLRERISFTPEPNFETVHHALNQSELPAQEQPTRENLAPLAPIPQEEATMKGKGRPKATNPSSRASLDELKGLVHDEFDRIWESAQGYLNDRLNQIGAPTVTSNGSGLAKRVRVVRWFQAFRPEIYLLLVLSLMGWIYRRELHSVPHGNGLRQQPSVKGEKTSGPVPSHTPQGPRIEAHQAGEAGNKSADDFASQWREYLRSHQKEAAHRLAVVADPRSPVKVGRKTRKSLEGWVRRLEGGQSLNGEDPAKSATALFEYVHAEWAKKEGKAHLEDNVVSLSTDEVTPEHLYALLEKYKLKFDPIPNRDDPNVQAAIVLRWIGSPQ